MEELVRKNFYSPKVFEECLNRIEKITPETRPQWGKMSAAQMFAHCAEIAEVYNGKELTGTPIIAKVFKGMIRKVVVGDKPYEKNIQTHPQYRQTTEKDFKTEKERLLEALSQFADNKAEVIFHPLFGKMSSDERGWSIYKHLDHHLNQFGA